MPKGMRKSFRARENPCKAAHDRVTEVYTRDLRVHRSWNQMWAAFDMGKLVCWHSGEHGEDDERGTDSWTLIPKIPLWEMVEERGEECNVELESGKE